MTRTSADSPLRIAALPLGAGWLGLTTCPGKQDPVAGWNRDLATDIAVIRDWGASTVVTLIEDHEFALLNILELPGVVRAAGMDWIHLPIRDVDVPDQRFEAAWPAVLARLLAASRSGERVLIHCRGGLGRTGLVAALVLIAAGEEPEVAIARVREVRPGAIETIAQEAYVIRRGLGRMSGVGAPPQDFNGAQEARDG